MARRLVFVPSPDKELVKEFEFSFKWEPTGMYGKGAIDENVSSLHRECADTHGITTDRILEVSGASSKTLGKQLSAMNLCIEDRNDTGVNEGSKWCVESLYQGSKVFENGGPHHVMYTYTGYAAKKAIKSRHLGKLVGFNYHGIEYPIDPPDAFYNWLYISVLCDENNTGLVNSLLDGPDYFGFTDIFFNHDRQVACQARAIAKFISMSNAYYTRKEATNFEIYKEQRSRK